jgi:UDP-glucose 4-epimerase
VSRPSRALVTGCAGFIGSHLTESLLADGVAVLGVDCFNDNYARREKLENLAHAQVWKQFEFVPIDLARGDLQQLVDEADVVFHLAAEPGVRSSWGARFDSYLRNNVLATQHLLEAAKSSPCARFVYASSSSVYGQAERFPTPEDLGPAPISPYGATKLTGEHLCGMYHVNHGVPTVILRFFTVYGPRQRPDMAFNIFCRAALDGGTVTVYGDGRQTRDFTYVSDVVDAVRAAAVARDVDGGVYNIGGGAQIGLVEAIGLIEEMAGAPLDVRHLEVQHGDVRDTGADTTRARQDLGFHPRAGLKAGLRAEFEWLAAARAARA